MRQFNTSEVLRVEYKIISRFYGFLGMLLMVFVHMLSAQDLACFIYIATSCVVAVIIFFGYLYV